MASDVVAEVRGVPTATGRFDLTVHRGEAVRIVGANGSGKTRVLRALAGLPDWSDGRAPRPRRDVGFSMQHALDGLIGLTVDGEHRLRGLARPAQLAALGARDIATLSSGEARRVALTCAQGTLILLDEPSEGLDETGRRLLGAIVQGRGHAAVVIVDHGGLDVDVDRTVDLGRGTDFHWPEMARPARHPILRMDATPAMHGLPGSPTVTWGPGLHVVRGGNGIGKTTLLRRLAGLDGGRPRLDGRLIRPGADVSYAPAPGAATFTAETVAQEVGRRAAQASDLVGAHLLPRHPLRLSGGETRRVELAKALGTAAPVVLLDEPEAHLDGDGLVSLAALLQRRLAAGATIVAASHDVGLARVAHTVTDLGDP